MSAELDLSIFSFFEEIILTKDGSWLSNGEEIMHERTIQAFARNIYRCKDGFEIRIGKEHKTIHVEDTLYFIVSLDGAPEIGFSVRLNDGRTIELDPSTLRYQPGRLTCKVPHPNEGTKEEAKFFSTAYYEILKNIVHDERGYTITIEGKTVVLSEK